VGLRTGTPDAEAESTTRSARLDPGSSYVSGGVSLRSTARLHVLTEPHGRPTGSGRRVGDRLSLPATELPGSAAVQ
jgi:hypothetical protein